MGTVNDLLNSVEAIVEHREYDSFGALDAAYDELGGSSPQASKSEVGYTGKFFDNSTGLAYYSARWYDPHTGRYLTEDPIQDGSNWYSYAKNNPILYVDPTGLSAQGNPLNNLYGSFDAYAGGFSGGRVNNENTALQYVNNSYNTNLLNSPTLNYNSASSPYAYGPVNTGSRTSRSSGSGTLVDLAFPVGPINTVSQPVTQSQQFSAYANSLGEAAIARAQAETAAFLNYRPAPTRGIGLDRFVDSAFAAAGNLSRYSGNTLGSGIEYVTSGYSGGLGNFVAGVGGGLAQLARTGGNIGAVVDLPRTVQATIADVNQGIQIGREHGVALGVGHFIGTNQVAQGLVGYDFAGQEIDSSTKFAEGFGRLGGTALTATGGVRLLYGPTGVPTTSPSRLTGIQANRAAGNAVSDAIAIREAGIREGYFSTVGGARKLDVVVLGDDILGIESKVGRTPLDSRVRQELARDFWLRRQGQVDRIRWEFSPNTAGELGPTTPLLQKIQKLGFETQINSTSPIAY